MKEEKNEKENNENLDTENENKNQIKPSSDIADSIVTILVDKIIADAVINSKINQVYQTMNEHCFNFLTNFMKPYLKSPFIFYENGVEDLDYQKKEIYFCRKPIERINTWTVLPEPKTTQVDRCANTKTKLVKYKKYTDIKDNGLRESSFGEEEIKHLKSNVIDKSKKEKNDIKERERKEKEKKEREERERKEKEEKEKKEKEEKRRKQRMNMYFNDNMPKKKEKEEILECTEVNDLPKESYENKYSVINSNDENNRLRKEKEIEIQKKEEMKIIEKERQERANRQSLMRRMEREFDSNRLTFDPNGKIISLRSQNYENFEDGFVMSRPKIKTEKSKKKPTLELMDVVYPIDGVEQPEGNDGRESLPNTRRTTLKGKDKDNVINKIQSDISKIKVEKNDEDLMWNNNNANRYNNKEKKESVVPSGANFDKIVPEVGVVITGENMREVKEGGFDYVKKYNKPSFNELSRYISESINLNSRNFSSLANSNNDLNKNNNSINNYGNNDYIRTEENNYIGYKDEFNDSNPLIQDAHYANNLKYHTPSKDRYNRLNSLSLNNSSIRRNLLRSVDRIQTDNNQFQSIQLSKNLNSQKLTNIFDDDIANNINSNLINSINVDNIENMNYLEKAVLPFKKLRYQRQNNGIRKLINLDGENNKEKQYVDQAFMNKFNSQIVKNKEWGREEEDVYKMQEKLNREMKGDNNQSMFRRQRNNRMKNLGMQIMSEGNNQRERRVPLFGGNYN